MTKAFRDLGHEAYSCDFEPCSGGHPEWHIQDDVVAVIPSRLWDMIILLKKARLFFERVESDE